MYKSTARFSLLLYLVFAYAATGSLNAQADAAAIKELTPLQQVFLLKQIKPDLERIGILCNLQSRPDLPKTLKRISAQLKVKIVIYDTRKKQNLARNFKSLVKKDQVDAVWVFPDDVLSYKAAGQYLIKQAVTSRIILVTHDPELVKKGATLSARLENGEMKVYINQKAAELLGLNPGEELTGSANIVMN